jgi:hypothetical protein
MKRSHSIAISAAAAVIAAAVVIIAYGQMRVRHAHAATMAPSVSTTAHEPAARAKSALKLPAGIKDTAPKAMPDTVHNGMKPPKLPANLPNPEELREQFAMLQRFLELSPERLTQIRESIERIERMPPERKKMMLDRIKNTDVQPLVVVEDPRAAAPLKDAPDLVRAKVSRLLEAMTPEERTRLLGKLQDYSPEQRSIFFEGMAAGASSKNTGKEENSPWQIQQQESPLSNESK